MFPVNIGGRLLSLYGSMASGPGDPRPPRRDRHRKAMQVIRGLLLLCGGGAALAALAVAGWDSRGMAVVAVRACLCFTGAYVGWRVVRFLCAPGYDQTLDWLCDHAGDVASRRVVSSVGRPGIGGLIGYSWLVSNLSGLRYTPVRSALNFLAAGSVIVCVVLAAHWARVRNPMPWSRRGSVLRDLSELIELASGAS